MKKIPGLLLAWNGGGHERRDMCGLEEVIISRNQGPLSEVEEGTDFINNLVDLASY